MSVKITDICISCGACIDECPVEAIVDDQKNPTGEEVYYVYAATCVECVGYSENLSCIQVCPVDDCIVWGEIINTQPHRADIGEKMRLSNMPVAD